MQVKILLPGFDLYQTLGCKLLHNQDLAGGTLHCNQVLLQVGIVVPLRKSWQVCAVGVVAGNNVEEVVHTRHLGHYKYYKKYM